MLVRMADIVGVCIITKTHMQQIVTKKTIKTRGEYRFKVACMHMNRERSQGCVWEAKRAYGCGGYGYDVGCERRKIVIMGIRISYERGTKKCMMNKKARTETA